MRRFWLWYLPLTVATVFSVALAFGFVAGWRGGAGVPLQQEASAADVSRRAAGSLLVLGDSLARGTGDAAGLGIGGRLDEELRRRRIAHSAAVNLAVNGSRTRDLAELLESANVRRLVAGADVVVVSIGGNDLWGTAAAENPQRQPVPPDPEKLLDDVEVRVADVIGTIRKASPHARIFLVGLYDPFASRPFGAVTSRAVVEWNSRLMRRFAADRDFTLVPTFDLFDHHEDRLSADHFHPGGEAYGMIARRIAEAL